MAWVGGASQSTSVVRYLTVPGPVQDPGGILLRSCDDAKASVRKAFRQPSRAFGDAALKAAQLFLLFY